MFALVRDDEPCAPMDATICGSIEECCRDRSSSRNLGSASTIISESQCNDVDG